MMPNTKSFSDCLKATFVTFQNRSSNHQASCAASLQSPPWRTSGRNYQPRLFPGWTTHWTTKSNKTQSSPGEAYCDLHTQICSIDNNSCCDAGVELWMNETLGHHSGCCTVHRLGCHMTSYTSRAFFVNEPQARAASAWCGDWLHALGWGRRDCFYQCCCRFSNLPTEVDEDRPKLTATPL